ncbi:MAG TPA: hypothetical protein DCK99_07820 [Blastocatellia bacterium]|nr:hypothetical protein [Blastocatellia bacterium]
MHCRRFFRSAPAGSPSSAKAGISPIFSVDSEHPSVYVQTNISVQFRRFLTKARTPSGPRQLELNLWPKRRLSDVFWKESEMTRNTR